MTSWLGGRSLREGIRPVAGGLLAVALLVGTGCGTRVEGAAPTQVTVPTAETAVAPPPSAPIPGGTVGNELAPAPASGGVSIGGAGSPGKSGPSVSSGRGVTTPTGASQSSVSNPERGEAAPPKATPGTAPKQPEVAKPAPATASPVSASAVTVASVGSYSGVPGRVLMPYLQGAQIWVKYINANNGLNGHQVRFLVYDDTADPARHRAQVQEAIEQKGAIAFLMNAETITGGGSVEYLKAKRVPVIGGTGGEDWATTSPMYFPQMTTGQANVRMLLPSIAPLTAAKGKSKLATLVCVEAPPCDPWDKALAETAGPAGFQHVYRARASLSQPDYTAECLAARNAGAQIVYMLFDGTAMNRVAAACARQGYRPTFATFGPGLTDDQRKDPLLDGTLGTSNTAPFFQSGTPATAEFQAAARSFGPNIPLSIPTGYGWVAGKVLQKAGANLSEPPTSESLLAGLWSIKNDTLGSLTEPLTFVPDQPPKQTMCWYLVAFKDTKWISPDDFKQTCL